MYLNRVKGVITISSNTAIIAKQLFTQTVFALIFGLLRAAARATETAVTIVAAQSFQLQHLSQEHISFWQPVHQECVVFLRILT